MSEPVISDDEAAAVDVGALLAQGMAEPGGGLRGELQGIGALAATIQLERDGVVADDVALAVSQLLNESMGVELDPVPLPPQLQRFVDAGRAATAEPGERELFVHWLGLVANLLMMRAQWGGQP